MRRGGMMTGVATTPEEQPLTGGNRSASVMRVGDTVRRPAGSWTPSRSMPSCAISTPSATDWTRMGGAVLQPKLMFDESAGRVGTR
jgi:hypothetical protein